MGKGSGFCDRKALVLESAPRVKLSVKPRKERTGWITTDGRVQFSRIQGKWVALCTYKASKGYLEERKLLLASGLAGPGRMDFDTLKEAREIAQKAFSFSPNPPATEIRQQMSAYEVGNTPFRVGRSPEGWWVWLEATEEVYPELKGEACKDVDQLETTKFSSRALVLKALEYWYESNYQYLLESGFIEEGFDG